MTIRDLINELNALVESGDVNTDANVVNAEGDDIFSVVDGVRDNEVVIYF